MCVSIEEIHNCIFMCLYKNYNYLLWIHIASMATGPAGSNSSSVVVVELLWSWVWVVMEVGVGCAQSSPQDTKPSNSLQ